MRCALVFYLVATVFLVVYSLPELCVFKDAGRIHASCEKDDVNTTFDFIPPVSQNISFISLWGQPLKQLPYNAFRNLSSQSSISKIFLGYCQISHVDTGALLNLHNLTVIEMSHNDIKQIDSKLFSHTKQIKYIYMGYNKLKVLPSGLFQNLLLLEVVDLNHNQIYKVERYSFKNTPSLWGIHLNNNQLEFMNMSFKDEFDNLAIFWLADNPWRCNCELGPLYEFLIKKNQLHLYEPVCEEPPTLHGRKWKDISRDVFVCRSEATTSTEDSFISSTEPMSTTEQDDNIPGRVYRGTTYPPICTGTPQPPSNIYWILYIILILVLVCVTAVIIVIIFLVRYTLATSNRKCHVQSPTIVKRSSDQQADARNMDSDLPLRVIQSSAVSENGVC